MKKNNANKTVLLVSVDKKFISNVESNLHLEDYDLLKANSHSEALTLFENHSSEIVMLDIENLVIQEMDLVHYIKTQSPKTEIIILATINELENATYSLHHGASFYLIKPIQYSDLKLVLEKINLRIIHNKEYSELEHRVLYDLMAGNAVMQKIIKLCAKIAPTTATVLLGGESGTGKEFFAKIIHRMSQRLDGKFIPVNCGAIPDTLFESELFGHKKGAFTGANNDKPGIVEEANMGTLFLDEIGELSQQAQVKLLRFLQEKSFMRVGDTTTRSVNVRIIAATNKDLLQLVNEGIFREDLYYRLNVFYITLPPLRERKDTIPNLIRLFVQKNNNNLGKNITKISKAAEIVFADYNYPGNIRELENIIEHAIILADSGEIKEKDLPEFMFGKRLMLSAPYEKNNGSNKLDSSPIATLAEVEKKHIISALQMFNNNYQETAKNLGISRSTLWRKIKTYNIERE